MNAPISIDDGDMFIISNEMGRIATVLLNCNLNQIQTLFDLRLIRQGDIGWFTQAGDANMLNMFLLRNELRESGGIQVPDLVDVSLPALKAAIQFLVEHGVDINYFQPHDNGEDAIRDAEMLISYGTPIELALYKRQFDMMNFLKGLGANPPRRLPILANAFTAYRNWASLKTARNSGKRKNMVSSLPKNAFSVIDSFVSGKKGGRRTRRRGNV